MAEYICPKCKRKAHVTQSVRGSFHTWEFDDDKCPVESDYVENMNFGKYRCDNCTHSSWKLEDMLEKIVDRLEELK